MAGEKREQLRALKESSSPEVVVPLLSEVENKQVPNADTDEMIDDLRRVQEEHPERFISRNLYRVEGKFSEKTWGRRFGTFMEFRKAAGLELHRGAQAFERNIALHSSLDRYRGFYEAQVAPFCGKYEKDHAGEGIKTLLIGSDFHDTDCDPFVLSVFLSTASRLQPDIIVLNGDIYDEYEFSHFDTDPRVTNIKERYDYVRENIFRPLRETCPNAQIDFIVGNHEHRIIRHMADRSPSIKSLIDLMGISFSALLQLDQFQINLICKSDLAAFKPADVLSEIKKNHRIYFDCFTVCHEADANFVYSGVSGHTHKPKLTTKVNEMVGNSFWYTNGCIAKVDVGYNEGLTRYQNGFSIVHIEPKSKEILLEPIMFSENLALVGGVYYRRPKK